MTESEIKKRLKRYRLASRGTKVFMWLLSCFLGWQAYLRFIAADSAKGVEPVSWTIPLYLVGAMTAYAIGAAIYISVDSAKLPVARRREAHSLIWSRPFSKRSSRI